MDAGTSAALNPDLRAERRQRVLRIAQDVVKPHASEVDREARFPHEAVAALREARLLSVAVPHAFGGAGAGLAELADISSCLGAQCASTAMVFAMHQIQVMCLVRHGQASAFVRAFLGELVERQLLVASVTSEVGTGGDLRSSVVAVETDAAGIHLSKQATTISYGEHADAFLATARSGPDAPANDQVLVLLKRDQCRLQRQGEWDTLGMRGTCSPAFQLHGQGAREQVLPNFGAVASATMVPYSHALWSSVWLGIASDAVARAHELVRAQARKSPGVVPPTATRLAEVSGRLEGLRSQLRAFVLDYEALVARADAGADALDSVGFALRANQLKVNASEQAVEIVSRALPLCGTAGYRNDTPQSVGRHLRDVYSSVLMIANERIHATNAQLLLVHKAAADRNL